MGSGFKDFAAGDILTAADVDGYLMRQTVMTFADASARDTALSGVLDEGMVAYLEDTNAVTVYNGSAWVAVIDSDVLTVDTANNRVGINDSTPSHALDVTGSIAASGEIFLAGSSVGPLIGFKRIGQFAFSGGAVVNVTLSGYDSYFLQFENLSVTGSGKSAYMRFGADAADYYSGGQYALWGGTTTGAVGVNNGNEAPVVYIDTANASANIWIDGIENAETTKFLTQAVSSNSYWYSGGYHNDATGYTLFQLFVFSDTIAGRVKVYGCGIV